MAFKFKDKIPSVRFDGFNEEKRRQKNKKEIVVSKRLVILIGVLFVLTFVLVIRLGYLQLSLGSTYEAKLEKYSVVSYTQDAPRGEIVDRNYTKLVKNSNVICVTYYAPKSISKEEINVIADFLAKNVNMDISLITVRDKKDYFIDQYPDVAKALISEDEYTELNKRDDKNSAIYKLKISRISEELINQYMDEFAIKKTKLKLLMQNCTKGSTLLIDGLTINEASVIGENSAILKGIEVSTDWTRENVFGNTFSQVLGKVTTKKQGLPAELKDELLALDYQNDARIGTSGLEQQYEDILRGVDTTYTVDYDSSGNPAKNILVNGQAGSDIHISIDWELQQYADQLIEEELKICNSRNKYFNKMFLTIMDPNNGDIIVMSGKIIDKETGIVSDYAAGNYLDAQLIGSTTKGGTLYTGFKLGLISPNEYIMDEPIKIKGTNVKKSWRNLGSINDIDSIVYSSNVYMFNIMMRLGEGKYVYDGPLVLKEKAFDTYRQCIGELGLGVKTGLDVPYESLGYRGTKRQSGLLLDLSIGQYDTYTNIQLAQYTSTLANGGKRIQPRLLLDAYDEDEEGNKYINYENKVVVKDDVSNQTVAFDRIQQGFRACVSYSTGLCRGIWASKPYEVAAKTGTAEFYDKNDPVSYSNTLTVGYAPASNPQVAFASMCYRQTVSSSGTSSSSGIIAAKVLDKYFEKYGIKTSN